MLSLLLLLIHAISFWLQKKVKFIIVVKKNKKIQRTGLILSFVCFCYVYVGQMSSLKMCN